MNEGKVYRIGPTRENTSLTELFLKLKGDETEKTVYIDEGTYDIYEEYRRAAIPTPPDDVKISHYFKYNAFLPPNTSLIGLGRVELRFAPSPEEISYGESRTWAPLNIVGACHVENIEIYCKNGRYCIHDDSHNEYKNTSHYYKNVRCTYEKGDIKDGKLLGLNNTIGNGMAQGCDFVFEDCTFRFIGGNHSAFYTHEDGETCPENSPTLTFRRCKFLGSEDNERVLRLQSLASADIRVITRLESCYLLGGIYLTVYGEASAQHFDVTLLGSGNPPKKIDREENKYPIKVLER